MFFRFGLRKAPVTGNRGFGTTAAVLRRRSCKAPDCEVTEKPSKSCKPYEDIQERQPLPEKVTTPRKLTSLNDWCGMPIEQLGNWDKSKRARMVFPRLPDPCNKSVLKTCRYCPAYCCKRYPDLECGAFKKELYCGNTFCKPEKKCK